MENQKHYSNGMVFLLTKIPQQLCLLGLMLVEEAKNEINNRVK